MARVLLSLSPEEEACFGPAIAASCRAAGLDIRFATPDDPLESIDYLVLTPAGPVTDFSALTGLRAALSLYAGVERIVTNSTLTAPLARMVDPGLTAGMVEYVTAHVLRYHTGLDEILAGQDGIWRHDAVPPLARARPIGMLGLGALGAACARALTGLGFPVIGWSRRPANLPGILSHAGPDGLTAVLTQAQILVTLLPATPATNNLLDAQTLARLPQGACIINPGRGTLIDDTALLAALDCGHLAHATLDVFRDEPLPPDHPFWSHRHVTVTPHIASATRPETAAPVIAENIRRAEAGLPLLNLVDRASGY